MRQQLTFNGRALSDFGVWFDGSVSFGSPERDVELVEVVGRNGALSISNDRFRNIEITFPCAIRTNFIDNYRNLMAFLNSSRGYCRLETTQEPNYYRLALFMNQTDPTGYKLNTHGRFDLVFQVKPQRFLKVGENWTTVSSSSSEISGNPVSVDNPSGLTALTGLSVDIEPVQSGEGDPSPTNIRPITGHTSATVTRTGKNIYTATLYKDNRGLNGSGAEYSSSSYRIDEENLFPNTQYTISLTYTGESVSQATRVQFYDADGEVVGSLTNVTLKVGEPTTLTFTTPSQTAYAHISINKQTENIQLEYGTEATAYEPYQGQTVTVDLNGTVYGGTLDVLTGVLTIDRLMVDGGDLTWAKVNGNNYRNFTAAVANLAYDVNVPKVLSSAYKSVSNNTEESGDDAYVWSWNGAGSPRIAVKDTSKANMTADEFKTAMTGVQFCYELANPTTVQLTAQQVSLLTGTNIISTDMNSLTVTIASPAELENPTLFESKPLIRVYGNGTLNVNDIYITVANSPYTYIDIDCELMDCYHGSNNANQYVSFSTTDYVTLRSGMNYFSYSGFTKVEVTPRWFEI